MTAFIIPVLQMRKLELKEVAEDANAQLVS